VASLTAGINSPSLRAAPQAENSQFLPPTTRAADVAALPTPDPYFQPKLQDETPPAKTGRSSGWDRPAPTPGSNQVLAERSQAANSPGTSSHSQGKSLWEPPRTPVRATLSNEPVASSIIRTIEKELDSVSTPGKPADISQAKDYTADLSQLRRQQASVSNASNPSSNSGLNSGLNSTPEPSRPGLPTGSAAISESQLSGDRDFSAGNSPAGNGQFDPVSSAATPPSPIQPFVSSEAPNSNSAQSLERGEVRGFSVRPESAQVSVSTSSPSTPPRPFEPTRLLAIVGNEPIFLGDLMFEINQLFDKYMPNAPQSVREREMKKAIPNLLNRHVESTMLYVDTLKKLPEQVDINKVLEQAGKEFDESAMRDLMSGLGADSPAELDAILRMQGTSLRKVRLNWSKEQITRFFLFQELTDKSEITHQQLLEEYNKNRQDYFVPAKARWEEIMIRFSRTASRQEAERMIVDLGNKIVFGANFATVAQSSSHGFTAENGGVHNWTSKGALVHQALDDAIFKEPIGELSDKIQTSDGYHIIRVLERTEAQYKPFTEAQVEIKERLREKQRQKGFEQYLNRVKNDIEVEYFFFESDDD